MNRFLALGAGLAVCAALGVTIAAQQPRIANGRLAAHAAGSSLGSTIRSLVAAQTKPGWIGYAVPVADRGRVQCCWTSGNGTTYVSGTAAWSDAPCCGSCRIEPSDATVTGRQPAVPPAPGPIKLEGSQWMLVMLRVVERQIERVRTFSEDCALDAGGREVHWIQDVRAAESLAFLESLVGADGSRKSRITSAALGAISLHAEPAAAETIERLARSHTAAPVRADAIFWLGQMAGDRVAPAITRAIAEDPDTEVKKRAVFALSQLPRGEGVPLLIDVARKNPNPAVKKQAIFWLGQSKDPRAVDFFAEILK